MKSFLFILPLLMAMNLCGCEVINLEQTPQVTNMPCLDDNLSKTPWDPRVNNSNEEEEHIINSFK